LFIPINPQFFPHYPQTYAQQELFFSYISAFYPQNPQVLLLQWTLFNLILTMEQRSNPEDYIHRSDT